MVSGRSLRRSAAALLALGLAGLVWALWGFDAHFGAASRAVQATQTAAQALPAHIEEGRYLARVGNCIYCHTAPGGAPLAGGRAIETPFGTVYASNLTPDPTYGLGRWSRDDFWQALHLGSRPDGKPLVPAFPYTSYTHISRNDADALWDFLQSQPPVAQPNLTHALPWPLGQPWALAVWRALFFQPAAPQALAETEALARGRYLVEGLGHCQECHSPRNGLGGITWGARGDGGAMPGIPWWAPSLRDAHQAGATDAAQTATLLQSGQAGGQFMTGPMAEIVLYGTQYLRDADAQAMAMYLQSLVTMPNPTATRPRQTASDPKGRLIYEDQCAACHGDQGQGHAGAYPALAGNRAVLMEPPHNAILSVLHGGFAPSTSGQPRPFGMPPFMLTLSDTEVAQVLNYARNSWGNAATPVSRLQVQQLRGAQGRP
jgi:mono/diheme cytochrome c family protein